MPAAQVLHREACLGLPQEPNDLRFRKSLLHVRSSFPDDRTLNLRVTQNGGGRRVRSFETIEELRLALLEFQRTYNEQWMLAKYDYQSPAQVRRDFDGLDAVA